MVNESGEPLSLVGMNRGNNPEGPLTIEERDKALRGHCHDPQKHEVMAHWNTWCEPWKPERLILGSYSWPGSSSAMSVADAPRGSQDHMSLEPGSILTPVSGSNLQS